MAPVSQSGVQAGLRDLPLHLLLEAVEHGAGLGLDLNLNVHKALQVLVLLIGVLGHQLGDGLALGIVGDDGPLAFDLGDLFHVGDGQASLFHAGDVQGLVEDIRLGVALVEHLDDIAAVTVDGFGIPNCDDLFQFHSENSSVYITCRSST